MSKTTASGDVGTPAAAITEADDAPRASLTARATVMLKN